MNISQIKVGNTTYNISDSVARTALESGERIHVLTNCTGTIFGEDVTWTGTIADTNVSTLYTGLIVAYKIPMTGGSDNTFFRVLKDGLQVYMGYDDSMDLPYHDENPVLLGSSITDVSKFPVGSIVILMFDENATVDTRIGNVSTTLQGCWKIINYKLGESLHYVLNITGTAAVTSKPYSAAMWTGTCPGVTSLYTGLTVLVKIPVAGNGSYGTVLNINEFGNHPVVANVNTMISTRYAVNCIITLVYDADLTANVYINSNSASSITGCWKIADYDSANIYLLRHNYGTYVNSAVLKAYGLLLLKNETTLIPVNSDGGTGTNKTITTEEFNPFGAILYWSNSKETTAQGSNLGASYLYEQVLLDLRYVFNTGTTLTANKDIYLVAEILSNGMAKLASTPTTLELPSTEDGKIYIYLGHVHSTYYVELHPVHPIYWYKNEKILLYTGIDPIATVDKTFVGGPPGSTGWKGYYKIFINNQLKPIDICFNVQIYASYKVYQLIISGLIDSNSQWSTSLNYVYPGSRLEEDLDVVFGYDTVSDKNIPWVAIPIRRYVGININTISCGSHDDTYLYLHNPNVLFSVEYKANRSTVAETLGGTIVKTRSVAATADTAITTQTSAENSNTSGALTFDGKQKLYDITLTGDVTGITLTANPNEGEECKVILNAGSSIRSVTVPYNSSSMVTTNGANMSFLINSGAFAELLFTTTSLRTYVKLN